MPDIMLLVLVFSVVGVILVVFGIVSLIYDKKPKEAIQTNPSNGLVDAKSIEMLNINSEGNKLLKEIEKASDELDKTSVAIFKELEEKYQELLFLYALIDDKKTQVSEIYKNINVKEPEVPKVNTQNEYSNQHLEDILEMQKNGLSLSEIARKLDLGQGEIKLILELSKMR